MRSFHTRSLIIALPLAVAASFALTGCQASKDAGAIASSLDEAQTDDSLLTSAPKHEFHYFPAAMVYRDCEADLWFWMENDSWTSGPQLPAWIDVDEEIPFAVSLATDQPYTQHSYVLSQCGSGESPTSQRSADDVRAASVDAQD